VLSVQILWASLFQVIHLQHFSGYKNTYKKMKKYSAPPCTRQNKQLKPNKHDCNNILDNNSMLCHLQSNAVGYKGLPDIQGVDFGMSDKDSIVTSSSSLHYIGLGSMSTTCYINVLLQWLLHLVPSRNSS